MLGHAAETNFWKSREKAVELARLTQVPLPRITAAVASPAGRSGPRLARPTGGRAGRLVSALGERHGRVRGVQLPSNTNGPVVVLIQDIHKNNEAQANIGSAVKRLHDENLIDAVALEGAFDAIDLAPYRAYPNPGTTKVVADYLLKTHRVSGPVHAALSSSLDIPIVGIDHPAHYAANVDAVRQSAAGRAAVEAALDERRRELERRKDDVFNPALRQFERAAGAYHAGKTSLTAYAALVARGSTGRRPRNVDLFLRAAEIEKRLDFAAVEADRSRLLASLVAKLDARGNEALIAQTVAYRMGRIGHSAFYAHLKSVLERHGVQLRRTPAMAAYIDYVLLTDAIDGDGLFEELERLERRRAAALAATPEERALMDEARFFTLAEKLAAFGLTSRDWARYRAAAKDRTDLEPVLASHEKFYAEAEKRDAAMADNLIREIAERNAGAVVLVVGGFHAEGIGARLAKKGVGVVSFIPRVTRVGSEQGSAYLSVFSREKSPLDRLFAGDLLFLGDNPAQLALAPALFPLVEEARLPAASFTGASRVIAGLSGGAAAGAYETKDVAPGVASLRGPGGTLTGRFTSDFAIDRVDFVPAGARRWLLAEDAAVLALQSAAIVSGQWWIGLGALAVFIILHLKNIPADRERAGAGASGRAAALAWVAGYVGTLAPLSALLFAAFGAPAYLVVARNVALTPLTALFAAAWVAAWSLLHARYSVRALAALRAGSLFAPLMVRRGAGDEASYDLRLSLTDSALPEYFENLDEAVMAQIQAVLASVPETAPGVKALGSGAVRIEFRRRAQGAATDWFIRTGDVPLLAALFNLTFRDAALARQKGTILAELPGSEIRENEVSVSQYQFNNHFIGRNSAAELIKKLGPSPRVEASTTLTENGVTVLFHARRNGAKFVWAFPSEDLDKVARMFALQRRLGPLAAAGDNDVAISVTRLEKEIGRTKALRLVAKLLEKLGPPPPGPAEKTLTDGDVSAAFATRKLINGAIAWSFDAADLGRVTGMYAAEIEADKRREGIQARETVQPGEIRVSERSLPDLFIGGPAAMARKIKTALGAPAREGETKTHRVGDDEVVFTARTSSNNLIWTFKRADVQAVAAMFSLTIKEEPVELLKEDEILLSRPVLDALFPGNHRSLIAGLNERLGGRPTENTAKTLVINGEEVRFFSRQKGVFRGWAFEKSDLETFARANGLMLREGTVPAIGDDEVAIAANTLNAHFVGSDVSLPIKAELGDPPAADATTTVSRNGASVDIRVRRTGTRLVWAVKTGDLDALGRAFDLKRKVGEVPPLADGEMSLTLMMVRDRVIGDGVAVKAALDRLLGEAPETPVEKVVTAGDAAVTVFTRRSGKHTNWAVAAADLEAILRMVTEAGSGEPGARLRPAAPATALEKGEVALTQPVLRQFFVGNAYEKYRKIVDELGEPPPSDSRTTLSRGGVSVELVSRRTGVRFAWAVRESDMDAIAALYGFTPREGKIPAIGADEVAVSGPQLEDLYYWSRTTAAELRADLGDPPHDDLSRTVTRNGRSVTVSVRKTGPWTVWVFPRKDSDAFASVFGLLPRRDDDAAFSVGTNEPGLQKAKLFAEGPAALADRIAAVLDSLPEQAPGIKTLGSGPLKVDFRMRIWGNTRVWSFKETDAVKLAALFNIDFRDPALNAERDALIDGSGTALGLIGWIWAPVIPFLQARGWSGRAIGSLGGLEELLFSGALAGGGAWAMKTAVGLDPAAALALSSVASGVLFFLSHRGSAYKLADGELTRAPPTAGDRRVLLGLSAIFRLAFAVPFFFIDPALSNIALVLAAVTAAHSLYNTFIAPALGAVLAMVVRGGERSVTVSQSGLQGVFAGAATEHARLINEALEAVPETSPGVKTIRVGAREVEFRTVIVGNQGVWSFNAGDADAIAERFDWLLRRPDDEQFDLRLALGRSTLRVFFENLNEDAIARIEAALASVPESAPGITTLGSGDARMEFRRRLQRGAKQWHIRTDDVPLLAGLFNLELSDPGLARQKLSALSGLPLTEIGDDELTVSQFQFKEYFVGKESAAELIKRLGPSPRSDASTSLTENGVTVRFYARRNGGQFLWAFKAEDLGKVARMFGLKRRLGAVEAAGESDVMVNATRLEKEIGRPEATRLVTKLLQKLGPPPPGPAAKALSDGGAAVDFYTRKSDFGRIEWSFAAGDLERVSGMFAAEIEAERRPEGTAARTTVQSDEVRVSRQNMPEFFIGGFAATAGKVNGALGRPKREGETRTHRANGVEVVFTARTSNNNLTWTFKRADVPAVAALFSLAVKEGEVEPLKDDEILISRPVFAALFPGKHASLIAGLNERLGARPTGNRATTLVINGEEIRFFSRQRGRFRGWAFHESDLDAFARANGLARREGMVPLIGAEEVALSRGRLPELYHVTRRQISALRADLGDPPNVGLSRTVTRNGRSVTVAVRKSGPWSGWAFPRKDSDAFAFVFDLLPRRGDDDLFSVLLDAQSLKALGTFAENATALAGRIDLVLASIPETARGVKTLGAGNVRVEFRLRQTGAGRRWAFKEEDAVRVAALFKIEFIDERLNAERDALIEESGSAMGLIGSLWGDVIPFLQGRAWSGRVIGSIGGLEELLFSGLLAGGGAWVLTAAFGLDPALALVISSIVSGFLFYRAHLKQVYRLAGGELTRAPPTAADRPVLVGLSVIFRLAFAVPFFFVDPSPSHVLLVVAGVAAVHSLYNAFIAPALGLALGMAGDESEEIAASQDGLRPEFVGDARRLAKLFADALSAAPDGATVFEIDVDGTPLALTRDASRKRSAWKFRRSDKALAAKFLGAPIKQELPNLSDDDVAATVNGLSAAFVGSGFTYNRALRAVTKGAPDGAVEWTLETPAGDVRFFKVYPRGGSPVWAFKRDQIEAVAAFLGAKVKEQLPDLDESVIVISKGGLGAIYDGDPVKNRDAMAALLAEVPAAAKEAVLKTAHGDLPVLKGYAGNNVSWAFRRADILLVAKILGASVVEGVERAGEDDVVVSGPNLQKEFIGSGARLLERLEAAAGGFPDDALTHDVTHEGRLIRFTLKQHHSNYFWAFHAGDKDAVAALMGAEPRQLPDIDDDEVALSGSHLNAFFVGQPAALVEKASVLIGDIPSDAAAWVYQGGGVEIPMRLVTRRGRPFWSVKSVDLDKVAGATGMQRRQEDADEYDVSISKTGLTRFDKFREDSQSLAARINLILNSIPAKDNGEKALGAGDTAVTFRIKTSGGIESWHFRSADAARLAALLNISMLSAEDEKAQREAQEQERNKKIIPEKVDELIAEFRDWLKDSRNLRTVAMRHGVDIRNIIWGLVGHQLEGSYDKDELGRVIDDRIMDLLENGKKKNGEPEAGDDDAKRLAKGSESTSENAHPFVEEPLDEETIRDLVRGIEDRLARGKKDDPLVALSRNASIEFFYKLEEKLLFQDAYSQNPDASIEADIKKVLERKIAEAGSDMLKKALQKLEAEVDAAVALQARLHEKGLKKTTYLNLYQLVGVKRMLETKKIILGDEMGLGKTLQTLAVFLLADDAREMLVLGPKLALTRWLEDVRDHVALPIEMVSLTDDLSVPGVEFQTVQGPSARFNYLSLPRAPPASGKRVIVMNYDLLPSIRTQREKLGTPPITVDVLALDEVHLLKNTGAARSKAVWGDEEAVGIQSTYAIYATGTPIENRIRDLFAYLKAIAAGGTGAIDQFFADMDLGRLSRTFSSKNLPRLSQLHLYALTHMVRRLARDVVKGLPPKTLKSVHLSMERKSMRIDGQSEIKLDGNYGTQQDLYNFGLHDPEELEEMLGAKGRSAADEEAEAEKEEIADSRAATQLIRLQQAALAPALLGETGDSIKFDAAKTLIEKARAEGKSVLVFSNYKRATREFRDYLAAGADAGYIDGDVGSADRSAALRDFQAGKTGTLIATIGTMSLGVEATRASVIIFLDYPWKPSEFDQAVARVDRFDKEGRHHPGKKLEIYTLEIEHPWFSIDGAKRRVLHRKRILIEMLANGYLTPEVLAAFNETDRIVSSALKDNEENPSVMDHFELSLMQRFRLLIGQVFQTKDPARRKQLWDEISEIYLQILEHKGSFFANMANLDYISGPMFPELKERDLEVLDVASGPSTLHRAYLKKRDELKNKGMGALDINDFDFSEEMLRFGIRREGKQMVGTFEQLGEAYPANAFDVVNISYAFAYAEHPAKLILDIHRLLKPNGIFTLILPPTNVVPPNFLDKIREAGFRVRVGEGSKLQSRLDDASYARLVWQYGEEFAKDVAAQARGTFTYLVVEKERAPSGEELNDDDFRLIKKIPPVNEEKIRILDRTAGDAKYKIIPEGSTIKGEVIFEKPGKTGEKLEKGSQKSRINRMISRVNGLAQQHNMTKDAKKQAAIQKNINKVIEKLREFLTASTDDFDEEVADLALTKLSRLKDTNHARQWFRDHEGVINALETVLQSRLEEIKALEKKRNGGAAGLIGWVWRPLVSWLESRGWSARRIGALGGLEELAFSLLFVSGGAALLSGLFGLDPWAGLTVTSVLSGGLFIRSHGDQVYKMEGGRLALSARTAADNGALAALAVALRLAYVLPLAVFGVSLAAVAPAILGVAALHAGYNAFVAPALGAPLGMTKKGAPRVPQWLLRVYRTTESQFAETLRTQNAGDLVQRLVDHVIAHPRALAAAWDLLGRLEKRESALAVPSAEAGRVPADRPIQNLADLLRRSLNHPRVAEQIRNPTGISRRGFLRFLGWVASKVTLGTTPATMEAAKTFLMGQHDPEIILSGPLARHRLELFRNAVEDSVTLNEEEKAGLLQIGDLNQLPRLYAEGKLGALVRVNAHAQLYMPDFPFQAIDENPAMAYFDHIRNMRSYRETASALLPQLRASLFGAPDQASPYLLPADVEAAFGSFVGDFLLKILESGRVPRQSDVERLIHELGHSEEAFDLIRGNMENAVLRELAFAGFDDEDIENLQPKERQPAPEEEDAGDEDDDLAWGYYIADVSNVAELIAINGGAITVEESKARFRNGSVDPLLLAAMALVFVPVGLVAGVIPLWTLALPAVAAAAAALVRFAAALRERKRTPEPSPLWLRTLGRALLRGAEGKLEGDLLPIVQFEIGEKLKGENVRVEDLTPAQIETLAEDVVARFNERVATGRYTPEERARVGGRLSAWLGRPIQAGDMKLKLLVSKEQVDERFVRFLARENRRRAAGPAAAPVELVVDLGEYGRNREFYDRLAREYGLKLSPQDGLISPRSRRLDPAAFRAFLDAMPEEELGDAVISFSREWNLDLGALEGLDGATLAAVRYRSLESLIDEILGDAPAIRAVPFSTLFAVFKTILTQA